MSIFAVLAEILFVGHSLVGPDLAPMVQAGLAAQGQEALVEAQVINGAPLAYQWDHAAEAEGVDGKARLGSGAVGTLILTEAIPLAGAIEWNDSAGQVAKWAGLAWSANPQTQVLIYETWHSLKSGTGAVVEHDPGAGTPWADRIAADRAAWQSLASAAEALRPPEAPPTRIVPAGQAMALAARAAAAGELPGVARIEDLFADDIHPNAKGLYLVAATHVAALTGQSPEGLPARLGRSWQNREARISPELALALQRIAWQAVQGQQEQVVPAPAPLPPAAPQPAAPALTALHNPALAFGLAGVNDWSVQQPFLDVMKTARPWTAHIGDQWGGMDEAALARDGWLDGNGWPNAIPPGISGISTLVLTDLPPDAAGVAGHYLMRWKGRGQPEISGRATAIAPEGGGLGFDYSPGEGAVIVTLRAVDLADPIRDITLVRADRAAALDAGGLFNPDWLARLRGARMIRFMDWMMTNDSSLATVEDSPKLADYTWARNGVPVEVMVALANELEAEPWFTLPHLAEDDLARFYAETVHDLLKPGLRAWVEYSNEVWNWQFAQARWAEEQGKARWKQDGTWTQFYALRASEIAAIWAEVFRDRPEGLVRVLATQTGGLGAETAILDAPLVVAEGRPAPKAGFDAWAVTGYFAALLGSEAKAPMLHDWLAESAAADPARPYALANARAAEELRDGRHSGLTEDTLQDVLTRVLPYQAEVARKAGLRLVMYEGGSHVVGYGPIVEDAALTAFFTQLNYSPEMGALYRDLLAGWARMSDAPFNAFVDIYTPGKWGSWGALRHLGDENPRWQALAEGCGAC